ncbi:MAG: RagB/SusD family nutrient uptake outer membrane protein [Bacteroidales bacterium]|nr:RagB/SusD family nutrient uptake outer membrane protein [Bacteroidales bacterium]
MKRITIILIALALIFQGCEEYLDKVQDSTGMDETQVFTDYNNFRKFQDRMYKDILNYLADYDYGMIAAMCDEGYTESVQWETTGVVQTGDWIRAYSTAQALQFSTIWNAWQSIRIANICLEKLPMLEGNATQTQMNQLEGQALFMRAWYYYEFLIRHGGMPYLTVVLGGSDDYALPRLSFHETVLKISEDCDAAAALLPDKWDMANTGRPTKGAAMAVKASAMLFDASPSNNPSNNSEYWTAAAEAAWDLIDYAQTTGQYKLVPSKGTDQVTYLSPGGVETITYPSGFDSIFMYTPYNDEIIWEFYEAVTSGSQYSTFTIASLAEGGIIQGYSPSQNIVDLFETQNGLAIQDDPEYDPQNPYIDRDPRFYHSILFNRERWTSGTDLYLELFNGGRDRASGDLKHLSYTGYIARKFWGRNVDLWSNTSAPLTHTIFFRYADILLMYAEAANEIGGPDYTLPGANMSAVQALNKVRERIMMPGVHSRYLTGKEAFRERIKNERAVELYLEGKRFFDLSRWGDAHKMQHRQLYGVDLIENAGRPTGYNISRTALPVVTLTFEQKHYKWPIPLTDALMFEEFKQNPGW